MILHMDDNTAVVIMFAIIVVFGVIAFAIYRFTGGD